MAAIEDILGLSIVETSKFKKRALFVFVSMVDGLSDGRKL